MSKENKSRRDFVKKTVASSLGLISAPALVNAGTPEQAAYSDTLQKVIEPIWRNKQAGMHYRQLGRTGMMISELCMGTYPFKTDECYSVLDASLERGVNYIDCAAAYSQGKVESNIGNYLKDRGNRENLFLTTKLSLYARGGYIKRIFESLGPSEQEKMQKKANELLAERQVLRQGYHFDYFDAQAQQLKTSYLWHVVLQEHGLKKEWKQEIKDKAHKILKESLDRLQTDYVDLLFCPHGASAPDLKDEILAELFTEFKQKGMIRASAVSFHNDVAGNLDAAIEEGYYDAAMLAYNIGNHAAVDASMYKAKRAGIGLLAMKVARLFVIKDKPEWVEDKLDLIVPDEKMSKFAKSYLWALQNPNLSGCVSEMVNLEQLEDNLQVVGQKLG